MSLALVLCPRVLRGHLAYVREKWVVWGQRPLASPHLIVFAVSVLLSIHLKSYDFGMADEFECIDG
jgi:hypothetical protein